MLSEIVALFVSVVRAEAVFERRCAQAEKESFRRCLFVRAYDGLVCGRLGNHEKLEPVIYVFSSPV